MHDMLKLNNYVWENMYTLKIISIIAIKKVLLTYECCMDSFFFFENTIPVQWQIRVYRVYGEPPPPPGVEQNYTWK